LNEPSFLESIQVVCSAMPQNTTFDHLGLIATGFYRQDAFVPKQ